MKIYSIIFLLFFLTINAQNVSNNFSMPVEKIDLVVKGKSSNNIFYEIYFVNDSINLNSKRKDIGILQIGDRVSKFSSYFSIKTDSLMQRYAFKNYLGAKEMLELMNYKYLWKNILLKDKLLEKNIIQDRVKNNYQYEDKSPNFDWKLVDEYKTILGYECRKATANFRGRNYIAWFTSKIPLNDGPFVFEGLPGLILEVYDVKSNYHFRAIAIDNVTRDIYLKKSKNIFLVNREKFREIQRAFYDNPSSYYGTAYNEDGTEFKAKPNSLPFNPIELK